MKTGESGTKDRVWAGDPNEATCPWWKEGASWGARTAGSSSHLDCPSVPVMEHVLCAALFFLILLPFELAFIFLREGKNLAQGQKCTINNE